MGTMNFDLFLKDFTNHLQKNIFESQYLYDVFPQEKNLVWEKYLASFPVGTNPIYREKTEHDCNACKSFIRKFGSVVSIDKGYNIVSVWDFKTKSGYQPIIDALAKLVKEAKIKGYYFYDEELVGTCSGTITSSFTHLHCFIPEKCKALYKNKKTESIESLNGRLTSTKDVFKNSLESITQEAIEITLELIAQNSLYRGVEQKGALQSFSEHHTKYHRLDISKKDNYCWKNVTNLGAAVTGIKNHSIGVFLQDISNNIDLEDALKKYESIMAPYNYKRPKAVFTKKMIEAAKKKIEELGYMHSLQRRCATIDDMNINNILFVDRNNANNLNDTDVFDELAKNAKGSLKTFNNLQQITIDKFISEVLPTAKEIKVLLENSHTSNFVNLNTAENSGSKSMFKWPNSFGWTYSNNITDSFKENVKAAGGNIVADLRCSLQWNDDPKLPNMCDLDLKCKLPFNSTIYYSHKIDSATGGNLDVDVMMPRGVAIENITWKDKSRLVQGVYKFYVHVYSQRNYNSGFKAEIEFNDNIYSYIYNGPLGYDKTITIADVTYKDNTFTIEHKLETSNSKMNSKEVWNLRTNEFQPVSMICLSPNFWETEIGNKHYFFMLKNCIADSELRGFFNEFLHEELMAHKHVFESLGNKMNVSNPEVGNQLSGLGFSSTKKNELICEVTSQNLKKYLKVIF